MVLLLCIVWIILKHPRVVPSLRCLVAGLSSRSPGFDPEQAHVRFVMIKVVLEQAFYFLPRTSVFPLSASFHQ